MLLEYKMLIRLLSVIVTLATVNWANYCQPVCEEIRQAARNDSKMCREEMLEIEEKMEELLLRREPARYLVPLSGDEGQIEYMVDYNNETCFKFTNDRDYGRYEMWVGPYEKVYMEYMRVRLKGQPSDVHPTVRMSACVTTKRGTFTYNECKGEDECEWVGAEPGGWHKFQCTKQLTAHVVLWIDKFGASAKVCEIELWGYRELPINATLA